MDAEGAGPSGRALTREDVLLVTKRARLEDVRTLNAWGMQLADVSVLSELPGVEVLSLSVNAIASLDSFQHSQHLRELYLRRNAVSDLAQLVYLAALPQLRVVWLADNPFASQLLPTTYRSAVLAFLPNVHKLDDHDVTPDEVEQALIMPDPVLIDAMVRAQQLMPSWCPPVELPLPPPRIPQSSASSPPHSSPQSSSPCSRALATSEQEGPLLPPPPPTQASRQAKHPEARVLSAVLLLLDELDAASLARVEGRCQALRRQRVEEGGE